MKAIRRKRSRKRGEEPSEVVERQTGLDDVLAREGIENARPRRRFDTRREQDKAAKADPQDQVDAARSVS